MKSHYRACLFSRFYKNANSFKWRFTTPGRVILLAMLVSGIVGLDTRQNFNFQIFSILTALMFLAIIFSFRIKATFKITRHLPALATVGEEINYRISITNQGQQAFGNLQIVDNLQWNFPSATEFNSFFDDRSRKENIFDRIVGFPRWLRLTESKIGAKNLSRELRHLSDSQQAELIFHLVPLRRGYLQFHHVKVGPSDLLGLFRRFQVINYEDKLLVLPRRYILPKIYLHGKSLDNQNGITFASAVGETGEFHSLREYQTGDPLRDIHWRSWARTGQPMVKTFEQNYFVRHALVLDTYASGIPTLNFEVAISLAASLALHIDDQESLLDIMFIEKKRYHLTVGRHLNSVHSFLETLACVEPQNHNTILELHQLVQSHSTVISSVICIFLHWDDARRSMVKSLREKGLNIIVLVICENSSIDTPPSRQDVIYLEAKNIETDLQQLSCFSKANSST